MIQTLGWSHVQATWVSSGHVNFTLTHRAPKKGHKLAELPGFFFLQIDIGVSKNRGTPKSSILIGFSIINHPFGVPLFLETPIFHLEQDPVVSFRDLSIKRCTWPPPNSHPCVPGTKASQGRGFEDGLWWVFHWLIHWFSWGVSPGLEA